MNKHKDLIFILDVDGVLTTGQFIYSNKGKVHKVFGPHDNDGLSLINKLISISFITADKRGFEISRKRIVQDMGYNLELVTEKDRYSYLKDLYGMSNLIYMGDGFYDAKVLNDCLFGIAPINARIEARESADFITNSKSGEGAVLDACIEIKKRYFNI